MPARRETGGLERQVLTVLWSSERPLTPAEILGELGVDLAYTTITTILVRLCGKGLVDRSPTGRAYAYAATVTDAELTARRMAGQLEHSGDRSAALAQFVQSLTKEEAAALRRLLAAAATR